VSSSCPPGEKTFGEARRNDLQEGSDSLIAHRGICTGGPCKDLASATNRFTFCKSFVWSAIELWRDYFCPHSRAALRQIGLSERHSNARRTLRWIRAHNKIEVGVKDIRREALCQSLDAKQTEELLDGLANAGWLTKRTESTGGKGRPVHRWSVNPILFGGAENAESAENAEGVGDCSKVSAFSAFPAGATGHNGSSV
jgi:hypothetical protein